MPVTFNLYSKRRSWLHDVDPRVKLLFAVGALVLLILFRNVYVLLAMVVLLHLLHLSAGTTRGQLGRIWRTLLPISLLMFILRLVFYPVGEPLLQLGPLRVTLVAAAQGLVLGLRIIAMALAVFAWLYTTDQPSLIRSFVKLKLPYEWSLVLALALRYIPTFQATFDLIFQAQQARGLDVAETRGMQRVRVMMPIFVAMVISSLRASDQLARALESRAFGVPGIQRTALHEIELRPADYALATIISALLVSLIFLYLRYGFGAYPLQLWS